MIKNLKLRDAAFLLIIGLAIGLIHKIVGAFYKEIVNYNISIIFSSILFVFSSITIIIFAYSLLVEIRYLSKGLKICLWIIIIFTSILILLKMPVGEYFEKQRIVFGISRLVNGLSVFFFLIGFYRSIVNDIGSLKIPILTVIIVSALSFLIGLIGTIFYAEFSITGAMSPHHPVWAIISFILFFIEYMALIVFLIRFRKVEDFLKVFQPI